MERCVVHWQRSDSSLPRSLVWFGHDNTEEIAIEKSADDEDEVAATVDAVADWSRGSVDHTNSMRG